MVSNCWKPLVSGEGRRSGRALGDSMERVNGLLWHKGLGQHVNGEFSMAVIQANVFLEDQSQFESGVLSSNDAGLCGTFVGVYDGHGGPEAARFVNENLFPNLKKCVSESREISANVIKKAFFVTEEEFLSLVKQQWLTEPQLASVGTCCLVGLICNGVLHVANAGDSRVVLGRVEHSAKKLVAIQLSTEHNVHNDGIRDELRSLHPEDPKIVVLKHNIWRVKGIIQVSRSIGDAYLKRPEFNKPPLLPKFWLPESFSKPILTPEPSISTYNLNQNDKFLIFASDGLWEHLSNKEAVDMVNAHPRNGIAQRLVKAAVCAAAKKREMRYSDLKKVERGVRRHFHDDITVVVVFIDHHQQQQQPSSTKGSPHSCSVSSTNGSGLLE